MKNKKSKNTAKNVNVRSNISARNINPKDLHFNDDQSQTIINQNSILARNLEALKIRDPLLYSKISSIQTNTKYEVFMGNDGANFNIIELDRKIPLYLTNPLEENIAKYNELCAYRYYPFLYFYGLGNGVLYSMMLNNEVLKRLVVIEPELEIIYIVLNLIDFSKEIFSNKIIILDSEFCNQVMINSLFDMDKSSKIYSKLYDLIMPNAYYEKYANDIVRINKEFVKAIEHNVVSVGNDTRDAIIGLQNHIQNLASVLTSPSLINLHSKIKGRSTAVIVSTGPSLYKQLDLLKEFQDYVTIFCIDASFPILYKHNIKPDIVFSLERVKESAKFYIDTPIVAQEDVIFALTSIVHEDTINAIKNGTKSFSLRPFGYTSVFKLKDYGYLGIGMSAANMAYELVVHAKFERCIIIGQDLAFSEDGRSHAKGAVYGENEIAPKENVNDKVFVEKYGGNGFIESTEIWRLFLNFYEKDIANTPYQIDVINATEGGARIKGTIEMPFVDALNLVKKEKKSQIFLDYPTKDEAIKNLQNALDLCDDWMQYGKEQQKIIEDLFLDLVKFLENVEELNKENNLEQFDYKKMAKIIDELDKVKETFNTEKFFNYFNDALQSYIFHQELDIAKLLVKPVENEDQKRAKELEWLYCHKYWLFSLAGGINTVVSVIDEALKILRQNATKLGLL